MDIRRTIIHSTQVFLLVCIMGISGRGVADHVLMHDGRVAYNVVVPDGAATGNALIRIRTGSMSFGFDPATNTVYRLPSPTLITRVADYVKTGETVGREQATQLAQTRRWNAYIPPRNTTPPLVAPSPAPKVTATPWIAAQEKKAPPVNVVPDNVPLDQRLERQLDLFMREQSTLVQDGATSVVRGLATPQMLTHAKVGLLQQQKWILEQYFPRSAETVRLAVEYWGEQIGRAQETGRFDLENL